MTFQPIHRVDESLRCVMIGLQPPAVAQVPRLVIAHLLHPSRRTLLSGVEEESLKTPIVVHPAANVEWCINRSCSVITVLREYLCQGDFVLRQWLPTHIRHSPATSRVVCSCRHRRKTARIVAVEARTLRCQGIQSGRPDRLMTIRAHVVLAEGVGGNPYDIHTLTLHLLPQCSQAYYRGHL